MVAARTDYDNYVTHVFCEPCIVSIQVSTLSPRYGDLLRTSLAFHARCESTGPDYDEISDHRHIMNTARDNVGLPPV